MTAEILVRSRGLEPPRLAALAPQASASASSATTARGLQMHFSLQSFSLQSWMLASSAEFTVDVSQFQSRSRAGLKAALQDCAMVFSAVTALAASLLEPVARAVAPRVAALLAVEMMAAYSIAASSPEAQRDLARGLSRALPESSPEPAWARAAKLFRGPSCLRRQPYRCAAP